MYVHVYIYIYGYIILCTCINIYMDILYYILYHFICHLYVYIISHIVSFHTYIYTYIYTNTYVSKSKKKTKNIEWIIVMSSTVNESQKSPIYPQKSPTSVPKRAPQIYPKETNKSNARGVEWIIVMSSTVNESQKTFLEFDIYVCIKSNASNVIKFKEWIVVHKRALYIRKRSLQIYPKEPLKYTQKRPRSRMQEM